MKRWTYKTLELKLSFLGGPPADLEQTINGIGAQGWELVSVIKTTKVVLVFKREG